MAIKRKFVNPNKDVGKMFHIENIKDDFTKFYENSELTYLDKYRTKKDKTKIISKEIVRYLNSVFPKDYHFKAYKNFRRSYNNETMIGCSIDIEDKNILSIICNEKNKYTFEIKHSFLREDLEHIINFINSEYKNIKPNIVYSGEFISENSIKNLVNEKLKKREQAAKEKRAKAIEKAVQKIEKDRLEREKAYEAEQLRIATEAENKVKAAKKRQQEKINKEIDAKNARKNEERLAELKRKKYLESLEPKRAEVGPVLLACLAATGLLGLAGLLSWAALTGVSLGILGSLVGFSWWWVKDDEARLEKKTREISDDILKSRGIGLTDQEKYDTMLKLLEKHGIDIENLPQETAEAEYVRE